MKKEMKAEGKVRKILTIALAVMALMLFTTAASAVVDVKIEKHDDSVKFIIKNVGENPTYLLNALTILDRNKNIVYASQDIETAEVLRIEPGSSYTFEWNTEDVVAAEYAGYTGKIYQSENQRKLNALTIDFLYLFSWDGIPGDDNERLIEVLEQKYAAYWARTANIEKIDDGDTIKVSDDDHNVLLKLDREDNMVYITLDDGRKDEMVVKANEGDGKLIIYDFLIGQRYLFKWSGIPGDDNERLINFLEQDYGIDWAADATIEKTNDGDKIELTSGEHSLSLELNADKTKLSLENDDGIKDELIVNTNDDDLSVFTNKFRKPIFKTNKKTYNSGEDVRVTFRNLGLLPIWVNICNWKVTTHDGEVVRKISHDCTYGYDSSEDKFERFRFMWHVDITWDQKDSDGNQVDPGKYYVSTVYAYDDPSWEDPVTHETAELIPISTKEFVIKPAGHGNNNRAGDEEEDHNDAE